MPNITIDGIKVAVPEGSTILQAAQEAGVNIPTLCHHPDQSVKANCRICVCEVAGSNLLQAACSQPATEGMNVKTRSPKVLEARKTILELILANHPRIASIACATKTANYRAWQLSTASGIIPSN